MGAHCREVRSLSAAAIKRLTDGPASHDRGQGGGKGRLHFSDGTVITDKGLYEIPTGESLVLESPIGGGFGLPGNSEGSAFAQDFRPD